MKKKVYMIVALALVFCLSLTACGGDKNANQNAESNDLEDLITEPEDDFNLNNKPVYQIGLCNYVDDASLNQIVDNIIARLTELGEENWNFACAMIIATRNRKS